MKTTPLGRRWGAIIRERRDLLGLSQYALADQIGVTQGAITAWERGVTLPSRRNVAKLCEVLNLPPSCFVYDAEVA